MYNKILVPIDIVEDELNQKMIKHVETLVSFNHSNKPEVHFLAVLPNLEIFFGIEIAALPESQQNSAERSRVALELLKQITQKVNIPVKQITYKIGIGSTKEEILSYASDIDADLILIASHSPNSSSYLLGSTAASIVRHAKITVLVVR